MKQNQKEKKKKKDTGGNKEDSLRLQEVLKPPTLFAKSSILTVWQMLPHYPLNLTDSLATLIILDQWSLCFQLLFSGCLQALYFTGIYQDLPVSL